MQFHVTLGAAMVILCLAGAPYCPAIRSQGGACDVAGYRYRPGLLPISSADTSVVTLQFPGSTRRNYSQLAAACNADPACVMFIDSGFLLSLEWGLRRGPPRSSPAGWSPDEALERLHAGPGILWAPKHWARRVACPGTYVATDALSQLNEKDTGSGPVLATVEEDMLEWNLPSDSIKCLLNETVDTDGRSSAWEPGVVPNPQPLGFKMPPRPTTYDAAHGYAVLEFSSHVERLSVCKALAANTSINPGCSGACRVGCCLSHLLSEVNNQAMRTPGDCTQRHVPVRMAPVEVRVGLHEECQSSCLAPCGFPRRTDLRWDVLRVSSSSSSSSDSNTSGDPRSNSSIAVGTSNSSIAVGTSTSSILDDTRNRSSTNSSGTDESADTRGVLVAMSSVVPTSMPATLPPPKQGVLGKADPACAIPGYSHLPGVLPSVAGGPLEVNLIGNHTTSVPALVKLCSSNPRCVFFTTTGRAVGLYQRLLGGLTPADTVEAPFGMPAFGVGWSFDSSGVPKRMQGVREAAVPLQLRFYRMPHCGGRCCGTYVAVGALQWQRVVAPPGQDVAVSSGAPPFPASIFTVGEFVDSQNWWLDTAARATQCSALRQRAAELRFPSCTPACRKACCDPDLPLVTPHCNVGTRKYTTGCAMVVQQAYEQCTQPLCEKPCGFHLVSRCETISVCPSSAFTSLRGSWRLTKSRPGGPVRASRQFLD